MAENETHGRVLELISALKSNQKRFEDDCGLGRGFVSRITRNVRKQSLEKIKARYPQVNINWIKTGRGTMFSLPDKDDSTIGQRLERFIRLKGYSVRKFEAVVGVSNGTLGKIGDNIRTETVLKIKEKFPDMSEDWLLYGKGDMISDEKTLTMGGTIKDRLRLFIDRLGVSEGFFLTKVGSSAQTVSRLNDNLPKTFLDAVHAAYPMLNMKWLTSGEGKVFAEAEKSGNVRMIPVVSHMAYAGYLNGYSDEEYMETLPTIPYVIGQGEDNDTFVAFEVNGDSMDDDTPDAYKSGDILICKQLELQLYRDSPLPYKRRDFVIVHKDGILIKRIISHDISKHTITIHSLSDDPRYKDTVLDLEDVRQMFTVEYQQRRRSR